MTTPVPGRRLDAEGAMTNSATVGPKKSSQGRKRSIDLDSDWIMQIATGTMAITIVFLALYAYKTVKEGVKNRRGLLSLVRNDLSRLRSE